MTDWQDKADTVEIVKVVVRDRTSGKTRVVPNPHWEATEDGPVVYLSWSEVGTT